MGFDVGAGLLGAAGGLLGGLASLGGPDLPDPNFVDPNLQSDPLNNAIAVDALLQLGDTTGLELMLSKASPLQQQIDLINRSPYIDNDTKSRAVNVAQKKYYGINPSQEELEAGFQKSLDAYAMAFGVVGLKRELNPQDRQAYEAQSSQVIERIQSTGTKEARTQAVADLARIAGNIGAIDSGRGSTAETFLRTQIDRDSADAREQALSQANAGGFNPAGVLGEIEKFRLESLQDSPFKALELEIGRLGALQEFLQQGTTNSQSATQIRNQGALSSAQIAANQISASEAARAGAANTQPPGAAFAGAAGDALLLGGLLGSKPGTSSAPTSTFGNGFGNTPISGLGKPFS